VARLKTKEKLNKPGFRIVSEGDIGLLEDFDKKMKFLMDYLFLEYCRLFLKYLKLSINQMKLGTDLEFLKPKLYRVESGGYAIGFEKDMLKLSSHINRLKTDEYNSLRLEVENRFKNKEISREEMRAELDKIRRDIDNKYKDFYSDDYFVKSFLDMEFGISGRRRRVFLNTFNEVNRRRFINHISEIKKEIIEMLRDEDFKADIRDFDYDIKKIESNVLESYKNVVERLQGVL